MLLSVVVSSCSGQSNPGSVKDTIVGQPKIIKNHFFEFPEEFRFVKCGLQDRSGKMWFGTGGNGIYVYDGYSFLNFTHKSFINFSLREDLNHNDILCCMEDKNGNIWFGTRRGLILYKPFADKIESKNFSLILLPENTITDSSRTRLPYKFQTGDNIVSSIMQDKSGKIWFGSIRGVYVHDPSRDRDSLGPFFKRFLDSDSLVNDQQLHLKNITGMQQDRNENIWFVSGWTKGDGIVKYDGQSLTAFKPDSLDAFLSVFQRQNGTLLFLHYSHGVYSYNGKSFSNFSEKVGMKRDTLVSMMEDQNGNLWFGHNSDQVKNGGDGGLWRYDGKSLKLFTVKDGLPHNHVFCIISDQNGNIWFGTRNTGLCKFDGKAFTDYTE